MEKDMDVLEYVTEQMAEKFNEWKEGYLKDIQIFHSVLESNMPTLFKESEVYEELMNLWQEVDKFSVETAKATYKGAEICTDMQLAFCLGEYTGNLNKMIEESCLTGACEEVLSSKQEIILEIFQI